MLENWITPDELEEKLGISKSHQGKMRMDGRIPYSKWGSKVYYKIEQIVAILEQNMIVGMT
jgi:hypothetical protein